MELLSVQIAGIVSGRARVGDTRGPVQLVFPAGLTDLRKRLSVTSVLKRARSPACLLTLRSRAWLPTGERKDGSRNCVRNGRGIRNVVAGRPGKGGQPLRVSRTPTTAS